MKLSLIVLFLSLFSSSLFARIDCYTDMDNLLKTGRVYKVLLGADNFPVEIDIDRMVMRVGQLNTEFKVTAQTYKDLNYPDLTFTTYTMVRPAPGESSDASVNMYRVTFVGTPRKKEPVLYSVQRVPMSVPLYADIARDFVVHSFKRKKGTVTVKLGADRYPVKLDIKNKKMYLGEGKSEFDATFEEFAEQGKPNRLVFTTIRPEPEHSNSVNIYKVVLIRDRDGKLRVDDVARVPLKVDAGFNSNVDFVVTRGKYSNIVKGKIGALDHPRSALINFTINKEEKTLKLGNAGSFARLNVEEWTDKFNYPGSVLKTYSVVMGDPEKSSEIKLYSLVFEKKADGRESLIYTLINTLNVPPRFEMAQFINPAAQELLNRNLNPAWYPQGRR